MNFPIRGQLGPIFAARRRRPTFTPASIPGLLAAWDPSVAGSVTSSGGLITRVADQSGHGYDLTATGSGRPTFAPASQNGLGTIIYDGSATAMFAGPPVTYPYTLVAVLSAAAANGTTPAGSSVNAVMEAKDLVSGHLVGTHFHRASSNVSTARRYDGGSSSTDATYRASTPAAAYHIRIDLMGSGVGQIIEDQATFATDSTAIASPNTATQVQVGSEYGGNNYGGNMGAVYLYSALLTTAQITALSQYLRAKWATA